jgi:hypothetical protein
VAVALWLAATIAGISVASRTGSASEAPSAQRASHLAGQWQQQRRSHGGRHQAESSSAPGPEPSQNPRKMPQRHEPRVTSGAQNFHPSQPAGGRHRRKLEQASTPPPSTPSTAQLLTDHVLCVSPSAASSNSPCRAQTRPRTARHCALLLSPTHDPYPLRTPCLNAAHFEGEAADAATTVEAGAAGEAAHRVETQRGSSRPRGPRKRTSWT